MNFGFSGEMIFIFFLALILFGPKKMPEIGRQVARFLGEFRRASNEFRSQIEAEVNSLDNNAGSRTPTQQILPNLQAPMGSLASRIFNPSTAQNREATEASAESAHSVEPSSASPIVVEAQSSAVPKVAPDA
jgi:sec-independent protein translocase protein TatB